MHPAQDRIQGNIVGSNPAVPIIAFAQPYCFAVTNLRFDHTLGINLRPKDFSQSTQYGYRAPVA